MAGISFGWILILAGQYGLKPENHDLSPYKKPVSIFGSIVITDSNGKNVF